MHRRLTAQRSRISSFFFPSFGEEGIVAPAPELPIREVYRRFWPFARPYRRYILLTLPFIVLFPAIETASIWLFSAVIDDVVVPGDFGPLGWIVPLYLALTILGGVVGFADSYMTAWVSQRFIVSLRTKVFEHLQELSLAFYERRQLGDLLARLGGDVSTIEQLLLSGVAGALSRLLRIIFFTAALFYLQWQLAVVALTVTPAFWFAARRLSRYVKAASREKRRRSGSITAVAEESLSNTALVQAYNRQETELERFRGECEGSARAQLATARLRALFGPLVQLTELIGVLGVIAAGTWAVGAGELSLGGLMIFLAYLSQLYSPVRGLTSFAGSVYSAAASAERVAELLDQQPAVKERKAARSLEQVSGLVELDDVSFTYPGALRPALSSLSLRVGPGQTLALVGPSGAGKSTIAKLLLCFYDPDAGLLRLDGHNLQDLRLRSLRDHTSVLLQETLVFDGTAAENIAYGAQSPSREQLVAAARAADAEGFISELPNGYDTVLGQRGRRLSGGQRQRIAIARALINDPALLVLDEPTTGLDPRSGDRIIQPLRRLMQGRTTIIISHNLATVRDADVVAVLSQGRLVESGPHRELLERGGEYAALHRLHRAGEQPPRQEEPVLT